MAQSFKDYVFRLSLEPARRAHFPAPEAKYGMLNCPKISSSVFVFSVSCPVQLYIRVPDVLTAGKLDHFLVNLFIVVLVRVLYPWVCDKREQLAQLAADASMYLSKRRGALLSIISDPDQFESDIVLGRRGRAIPQYFL